MMPNVFAIGFDPNTPTSPTGTSGDDSLTLTSGFSSLDLGDGDDTVTVSDSISGSELIGGSGTDKVILSPGVVLTGTVSKIEVIETVAGATSTIDGDITDPDEGGLAISGDGRLLLLESVVTRF
jgi:hypothetical protein